MEFQENISGVSSIDDICRTCLISSVKMFPIFNIPEESSNLLHKIRACTSITIFESDGLPQNVCERCIQDINIAFNLRKQSSEADIILRQRTAQLPQSEDVEKVDVLGSELFSEAEQDINRSKRKRTRKIYHDYLENDETFEDDKNTSVDTINSQENCTCNICGKVSVSYRGHCIHMAKHNGSRGNYCPVCDKTFPSGISAHMRIHTGEKPFKCTDCDKSFRKSSTLKDHQRSHLGIKPHICSTCGRGFGTKRQMEVHTRIHTGIKPHLCNVCGKKFSQLSSLSGHLRIHTGERPYKCNICSKVYSTSSALTQHRAQHASDPDDTSTIGSRAKALCNICGKHYRSSTALLQHMTKHTGLTKYNCNICGRGFAREDHLRVHTRIHTGERPFACSICSKTFTQSNVLRTHMALHTGKTISCHLCGSTFARPALLRRHLKMHSEQKSFQCRECDKIFLEKCQLTEHSKLHIAERNNTSLAMRSSTRVLGTFEQPEKLAKHKAITHSTTFQDISSELNINYDDEENEQEDLTNNGNIIVIKPISNPNCTAVINMQNHTNLQQNNELYTIEIITKNEDEYVSDLIESHEET